MRCYDQPGRAWREGPALDPAWPKLDRCVLLCAASDMDVIQAAYGFDEDTVRDCTDLDESVRLASYPRYDFISLVHLCVDPEGVATSELNLYLSDRYLILVAPPAPEARVNALVARFYAEVAALRGPDDAFLSRALGALMHLLLQDLSGTLESLEDMLEALQDRIIAKVDRRQISDIVCLHKQCYAAKKHLRALADVGDQLLVNGNGFLLKSEMRAFQSLNGRLGRQRDYAGSLYELSNQLQSTYDSKMQSKTNEAVNKLTVVTVFFGPLTVITGIYGMNFVHMPELQWWFGYPMALVMMVLITVVIYFIFKRSEWL